MPRSSISSTREARELRSMSCATARACERVGMWVATCSSQISMLCRSAFTFVFFTFFFLACIDAPRFDRDDAVPEGSASATDPHVGMVLVPAATLAGEGNVAPSAKGGDDDDEDNKGKGGGGTGKGGGPPPTPTPPSNPTIDVAAFWIDALEVSASDYAACVGAGACAKAGDGPDCTVASSLGTHPVNCVTFSDATRYC